MDYIVYDVFNNAFYVIMSFLFCGVFFRQKDNASSLKTLSTVVAWIVIQNSWAFLMTQVSLMKVLIDVVIGVAFVLLLYDVHIIKVLIIQILYLGLYISGELAVFFVDKLILNIDSVNSIEDTPYYVYSGFVSQLIVFFIIVMIRYISKKKDYSILSIKDWIPFIMLPVFTICVAVATVMGLGMQLTRVQETVLNWTAIGMILMNLTQYYTLTSITSKEMRIRERDLLVERAKGLEILYSQISEGRDKQKAITHDMVNCLLVSLSLAKSHKNKELVEFLSQQLNVTEQCGDVYDCGNSMINAIINTKYIEAKNKHIRINFYFSDLSNLKIPNIDLIVIIANMIDNAIEASELIPNEDRWISFRAEANDKEMIICAENSYNGSILVRNGNIVTTKKTDKENHGYGLSNINSVVKKNNGEVFINTDENVFKMVIILPL